MGEDAIHMLQSVMDEFVREKMQNNTLYKLHLDAKKKERRQTIHSFHRFYGKLIPAIPCWAISEFAKPGYTVADVFCGSGTTLVEARMMGRNSFGLDIVPLACLITKAKSTPIDPKILRRCKQELLKGIRKEMTALKISSEELPKIANLEHWFRPDVINFLYALRRRILKINVEDIHDFFLAAYSAIMRDVSNADPRQVFPGYSKRLRMLDKKGLRNFDPIDVYNNGLDLRIKQMEDFYKNAKKDVFTRVYNGDARDIPDEINGVDLIVINPPYLGSIRYIETIKLEMAWVQNFKSREDLWEIDRSVIATERIYAKDYSKLKLTGYKMLDDQIGRLYERGKRKMANVVARYFLDMKKSFQQMYEILCRDGHLVIKIGDSLIRKERIPTHEYFINMAKEANFTVLASFKDEIRSRSLLTKRNWYSDMLPNDWILVFKKR